MSPINPKPPPLINWPASQPATAPITSQIRMSAGSISALSPAINAPTTAVQALDEIEDLLNGQLFWRVFCQIKDYF
jgi:hypothetical protein